MTQAPARTMFPARAARRPAAQSALLARRAVLLALLSLAAPAAAQEPHFSAGPRTLPAGEQGTGPVPAEGVMPPAYAFGPAEEPWSWQLLPDGLIYRSYLAGRESRLQSLWIHDSDRGWLWDVALGGRVGVFRYGTTDQRWPQGWQFDLEGAGFPRLEMEDHTNDVIATDFRFGMPLTYGYGPFQTKLAYYHLSSHAGDELLLKDPTFVRINYARDCLVLGNSWYATPDVRLYGEASFAFNHDGGAEPWEFQFGIDYSPAEATGLCGAPFAAINAHLQEELDYGGALTVQAGWQWRGGAGHLIRTGFHYLTGHSPQLEFYSRHEEQLGFGIWYDY
jgi:hypothetical protein